MVVNNGNGGLESLTWDNPNVVRQDNSLTVNACNSCRWKPEDHVPEHPAFRDNKRVRERPKKYREPEWPQTQILYEGYRQLLTVSMCFKEEEIDQLLASESAELLASKDPSLPRDNDAAPPRSFALTLLVRDSPTCVYRRTWLDCMAYWANCVGAEEGDDARAAGDVRFAALANRDARKYGVHHGRAPTAIAEIALAYVAPDGKIAMAKAELAYKDTGRKMFKALRTTAATLFEQAAVVPPHTLFRSMNVSSEDVEHAFWRTWQHTNDTFWDMMIRCEPPPPLHGETLEFPKSYVKIGKDEHVKSPQAWKHEGVDFGMLCCKTGMSKAMEDFLCKARGEELAMGAPENEACIRPADRDADELNLNLHILRVSHMLVSFKGLVSCFGARAAPGAKVAPWHLENSWPGVRFDFTPFTRDTYNWVYVLTCNQEKTQVLNDQLSKWQYEITAIGADRYLPCFGFSSSQDEEAEEMFRSLKRPCHVQVAPQPEDAVLANLVGEPFFSGAFRLGDVYNELGKNKSVQMPALSAFLVSAMGKLGPEASMASALATWVDLRRACDVEVTALRAEIEALKSAASTVVAPPPPDNGPYKFGIVTRMITAMGLTRKTCYNLGPLNNDVRAKAIVKVLSISNGVHHDQVDLSQAEWGSDNCRGMSDVEAIAAAGHQLKYMLVIAVHSAGQAQFHLVEDGEDGKARTKPIAALNALELSISQDLVVVLYREESTQLIACVPSPA